MMKDRNICLLVEKHIIEQPLDLRCHSTSIWAKPTQNLEDWTRNKIQTLLDSKNHELNMDNGFMVTYNVPAISTKFSVLYISFGALHYIHIEGYLFQLLFTSFVATSDNLSLCYRFIAFFLSPRWLLSLI